MNATEVTPRRSMAEPPPEHLVEAATALAKLMGSTTDSSKPVPCDEGAARSVVSDNEDDTKLVKLRSPVVSPTDSSKREIFPHKLMAILNDPTLSDVVSWLPHGKSFVIIRPDVFTEKVLPAYLPPVDARSSTKYPSFTRKLNRWGFRQATRGPDTGAFHHPLFRRDQPELSHGMVCQRSRDRKGDSKDKDSLTSRLSSKRQLGSGGSYIDGTAKATPPPADLACAMEAPATNSISPAVSSCAASVTDDSRSDDSQSEGAPPASNCARIPKGITTDKAVVAKSLQQRDELERLRVAKAMLYQSYLEALHNTNATHNHIAGKTGM